MRWGAWGQFVEKVGGTCNQTHLFCYFDAID
jgi:hypothetical protein